MQAVIKDNVMIQKLLALIAAEKASTIEGSQTEMEEVGEQYTCRKISRSSLWSRSTVVLLLHRNVRMILYLEHECSLCLRPRPELCSVISFSYMF